MEFKNPQIPEGINVSDEHPLKGLTQLVLSLVVVVVLIMVVLHYSVQYLVHYIPFEFEVEMSDSIDYLQIDTEQLSSQGLKKQEVLQVLADELSLLMELPVEMVFKVL